MKMDAKIITSNLIWRFLERFGAQGVTFIVSIVLARILDPAMYGTIALVTVITTILQVFVDSGLGSALIQKKDADTLDFSTVFFFNFFVCIILYIGLFFASPFIARYYRMPEITTVIRAMGLILIISGFKNIQAAYVSRHLIYKKYFIATLGGTISAAVVGIWMAYNGYGVWALVAQNIVNQTIDTVILWIIVKWRPTLEFSWERLKGLFSYGWKLLASSLLDTLSTQLRQLIIGRYYTSEDLAYYNKGHEYPQYATQAMVTSIDSVLFPVMSFVQEDVNYVKEITRKAIKVSSFCLWPMMIGLAACSKSVITLLLTDKWLPCAPYLIIFCINYAFYPIHTANLNAIKAVGRSDIFLKLEITKKVISFSVLFATMWFGPFVMAVSTLGTSLLSQLINSWPNRKLLDYKYIEQIKDILPSIGLSAFMGICVYCVNFLNMSTLSTLIIQIAVGVIIYLVGAMLVNKELFIYCLNMAKGLLHRKNN